jgi:predicted nucleotidyltransferase
MGQEIAVARNFAVGLRAVYGEALKSVVLYGSAARGEYREGRSDLNVLVLLEHVDAGVLRQGSAHAREWVELGNPPPMLFGQDEWRQSADAFPIEFADIKDAHTVLYGDDPFLDVEIDVEHLRLQCEHELKAKQVQLRERYMLLASEPEQLVELLVGSVPTFLVLFRTVLRLAGADVPRDPEHVLRAVARLAAFEAQPIVAVQQARSRGTTPSWPAESAVAVGYLDAVSAVVEFVDRFGAGQEQTT